MTEEYQHQPDYAAAPGQILAEYLEEYSISQAEFARRCGRSAKLISEIISGKAPLEPETALQFEKILSLSAHAWLGLERNYRLHLAREKASIEAESWIKSFPSSVLVKLGIFKKQDSFEEKMNKLLAFFGVGSIDAWNRFYRSAQVFHRHSPTFQSNVHSLALWLRQGELEAESLQCQDYSKSLFKNCLKEVRALTRESLQAAIRGTQEICQEAGVAVVLVPKISGVALSGAARWLTPKKALIQLSMRHKTNDHLWFTFFHEAAHILLHSKKLCFLDDKLKEDVGVEREANKLAENMLIPKPEWNRFLNEGEFTPSTIETFASQQQIAPGVIVGRLQHNKLIGWQSLNSLKVRLESSDWV